MKVKSLGLLLFVLINQLKAQTFVVSDNEKSVFISTSIKYFIDSSNSISSDKICSINSFRFKSNKTFVFKNVIKSVWGSFDVQNNLSTSVYLDIAYSNLSLVTLYKFDSGKLIFLGAQGNSIVQEKNFGSPNIVFNLKLNQNKQAKYFLHVQSIHPIILPIYLSTNYTLINSSSEKNVVIGFYFGLLAVMFFYNLFLYILTKDRNYILYITYIFFLFLAQLSQSGYGYCYLWPHLPELNILSVIWMSSLSGIFALEFFIFFLNIRSKASKIYPFLILIILVYVLGMIASLFKFYTFSYSILNYNFLISVLTAFCVSFYLTRKGYKPAIFFLVAWTAFLISIFILVLTNWAFLPYTNFNSSALYIGSGLEVILLSIALADRINILKKEKEHSQAEALQRAKENEQLVRDQNVDLEKKVEERTHELQASNAQLNGALVTLKDAQTQLVESEKMASLGQLTAGIAHEINNPINFVKSNINPLRLDVKDLMDVLNEYDSLHTVNDEPAYKKKLQEIQRFKKQIDVDFVQREIDNLIVGIEEGAERTAEIVQGLRTFSRLDEAELKTVDIHEGILSTLVLLKNATPYYIKIIKNFKATSQIECYPGKLNQVFMNMISNSIQAITAKKDEINDDESIIISSKDVKDDCVEISIKDTGIGMTEDVKQRIFEPFFTTKEVGEGTGLGMAIVFKILQKHGAKIQIITKPLKGSEFIITLPYKHPVSDHL